MAMIICPECGAQVSDRAGACIKCGCPIKNVASKQDIAPKQSVAMQQGKATFQATGDFIGLAGKYVVMDENGNKLAKLKARGFFETKIDRDTVFCLKYSGGFGKPTQVMARANKVNNFTLGLNGGAGLRVDSN